MKNHMPLLKRLVYELPIIKRLPFTDPVNDRLREELQLIEEKGLAAHFIHAHLLTFSCSLENIYRAPCTGLEAQSLVCFCLGISEVNPMESPTFFELLLHPDARFPKSIGLEIAEGQRLRLYRAFEKKFPKMRLYRVAVATNDEDVLGFTIDDKRYQFDEDAIIISELIAEETLFALNGEWWYKVDDPTNDDLYACRFLVKESYYLKRMQATVALLPSAENHKDLKGQELMLCHYLERPSRILYSVPKLINEEFERLFKYFTVSSITDLAVFYFFTITKRVDQLEYFFDNHWGEFISPYPQVSAILDDFHYFVFFEETFHAINVSVSGFTILESIEWLAKIRNPEAEKEVASYSSRFLAGCEFVSGLDVEEAQKLLHRMLQFRTDLMLFTTAKAEAMLTIYGVWYQITYELEFAAALKQVPLCKEEVYGGDVWENK